MKNYLVTIKVNDPFPKEFQKRVEASNMGLAVYRAYKKVKEVELKHRRIKKMDITVI